MDPEDAIEAQAAREQGGVIRPFRVIPGGAEAIPEEYYAAGIIFGALALLYLVRRNLGAEGRTMVSGTAAVVFLLYFILATVLVRTWISLLSAGGERDTAFTRGVATFSP